MCSYMSQSEGGEYPLPALFCKVTLYFVFRFVFYKVTLYFEIVFSKVTMLTKDERICQISSKPAEHPIFTLRAFFISLSSAAQTFDEMSPFSTFFSCGLLQVSHIQMNLITCVCKNVNHEQSKITP